MSSNSKIEWTGATWNPVTGCTPVSAGCENCYAKRGAKRFAGRFGYPAGDPFRVTLHPARLDEPLHWRKRRPVFVCSMGDLFHKDVPFEFVDRVFATMASSSLHMYQVLTKRPSRMAAYLRRISTIGAQAGRDYERRVREHFAKYKQKFREGYTLPEPPTPELRALYDSATKQEDRPVAPDGTTLRYGFSGGEYHWRAWPLSNVCLGTTVENQQATDERIPHLLNCPAAVRFLSVEPMLGPIHLRTGIYAMPGGGNSGTRLEAGIDWVIFGCESGPGRRSCDLDWVRDGLKQCRAVGVPAFVKQIEIDGKVSKDPAEWPEDLRIREYPRLCAASVQ